MERHEDHEARLGVSLVTGFAAFILLALAMFYFPGPANHAASRADRIADIR
jgi:hypothetical protein